jgi:hypothetical protein
MAATDRLPTPPARCPPDPRRAGITSETVTAVTVKGFVDRDRAGDLALTDNGLAVSRAMLPDL